VAGVKFFLIKGFTRLFFIVKSFQISRLQLFEMIDELFADIGAICHHEKLPNNLIVDGLAKSPQPAERG